MEILVEETNSGSIKEVQFQQINLTLGIVLIQLIRYAQTIKKSKQVMHIDVWGIQEEIVYNHHIMETLQETISSGFILLT